jgi:hypothetical protein
MTSTDNEVQELKQYIKDTLGNDIIRLTRMVDEFNSSLRNIEITTSGNTAKIEGKLDSHSKSIEALQKQVASVSESQKFRWKEHDKKEEEDKEQKNKSDLETAKILNSFSTIVKLLWFVSGLVITMIMGLLWSIFINGGIRNLP